MTISKKNQPSEESVGHAPYYRTSSPVDDRVQQALHSTKHLLAAKGIKMKEIEIVPLRVQDPEQPVGCPVVMIDDSGLPIPTMTDIEHRLQRVLELEGISKPLLPTLNHGNSHNREMLLGSKITDCFGGSGVVVKVVDDTELPNHKTAGVHEYAKNDLAAVIKRIVSTDTWKELRFAIITMQDVFGDDMVINMAQNKEAPAYDVYTYISNTVTGAPADYIERAIGEQYGMVVLNKAKAARAAK